jgi:hypothetical protein
MDAGKRARIRVPPAKAALPSGAEKSFLAGP